MSAGDEARQHQMKLESLQRDELAQQSKKKNEQQEITALQRQIKGHMDKVAQIDGSIADLKNREQSERQAMQGAQNKAKIEQQQLDAEQQRIRAEQQRLAA